MGHDTCIFDERGDQTLSFGMFPILSNSPGEMIFPDSVESPSERNRTLNQLISCCYNIAKALHTINLWWEWDYTTIKKTQSGGGLIVKPHDQSATKKSWAKCIYIDITGKMVWIKYNYYYDTCRDLIFSTSSMAIDKHTKLGESCDILKCSLFTG